MSWRTYAPACARGQGACAQIRAAVEFQHAADHAAFTCCSAEFYGAHFPTSSKAGADSAKAACFPVCVSSPCTVQAVARRVPFRCALPLPHLQPWSTSATPACWARPSSSASTSSHPSLQAESRAHPTQRCVHLYASCGNWDGIAAALSLALADLGTRALSLYACRFSACKISCCLAPCHSWSFAASALPS